MSLRDDLRALADQTQDRLSEAWAFYIHCRQAWRLLQQLARKGQPVGIVDLTTKRHLLQDEFESRVQKYTTVQLTETTFRELCRILEEWVLGLIRIWLIAYPEDLDLEFDPATGQRRNRERDEIQVPLSRLLHLRDCDMILGGLIEAKIRDLSYQRPEKWFQYLETRMQLGSPDLAQRAKLHEMKAARDCLEHNRGVVNRDYVNKAGAAARFTESQHVQIDEPYLIACFSLLRDVTDAMANKAAQIASGPKPPRKKNRGRGKSTAS